LPPNAKLLFFYLLTNSRQTACGAFQVTRRAICHETNLTAAQVSKAMANLSTINKVIWWPDADWVLLTRFYRHQRANASKTYEVAARKAAAVLHDTVYQAVVTLYPELTAKERASAYPPPTLPVPCPTRARETETESVKQNQKQEAGTETAPDRARPREVPAAPATQPATPPRYSVPFEAFWRVYPRREKKPGAWDAWLKIAPPRGPTGELADLILAGVATWQGSEQWARGIYPHASTWLHGRQWEDEPVANGLARASPNARPTKMDNVRAGFALGGKHDRDSPPAGHGITVRTVAEPGRLTGGSGHSVGDLS
jgi:hypothetical protein